MRRFHFFHTVITLGGLVWGLSFAGAQAGSVVGLADRHEVDGKLTLGTDTLQVDGPPASEIKFPDILEATFSDVPFHVPYFQSAGDTGSQFPPGWTAKTIGPGAEGSASYASGTITITGDGAGYDDPHPDHSFFAGLPWQGDGQWTAYLKELTPPNTPAQFGLTLRKALEENNGGNNMLSSGDVPLWIRATRVGNSVDTSSLIDGKWGVAVQEGTDPSNTWLGFMLNSRQRKVNATAVIDHITFTPGPAQPETVPPGILLTSGTFFASTKVLAAPDFFLTETDGGIRLGGKKVALKTEQVAAVVYHPVTLHDLAAAAGQQGLILKNSDFLASDVHLIQGGRAQMTSLALGMVAYYPDNIRACVVSPVAPVPSDYEIRLHDGSNIRAKSFSVADGQLSVEEAGGLSFTLDASEIAQVRAGLTRVQPLIALPWKVRETAPTASPTTPAPPAITQPPPAAPPIDAIDADAAKSAALNLAAINKPEVATWSGLDQEQMLVIPAAMPVDFPLKGKFRCLAMRVMLAPGVPVATDAKLRILADGRQIKLTPPVKSGNAPSWIDVPLSDMKTLTFEVDSSIPDAKLVIIDPVAIRDTGAPKPAAPK